MAHDKLKIINNQIKSPVITTGLQTHNFSDYIKLHNVFLKYKKTIKTIQIYDITYNPKHETQKLFSINDHINRTGNNPFIGKQNFFNIDFINVENIYLQKELGVTTTSCANRYEKEKTHHLFPSTYIANISALAHIHQYKVEGFLVNQL